MKKRKWVFLVLAVLSFTPFFGCSEKNPDTKTSATPVLQVSPPAGSYDAAQTVTISISNGIDCDIYYVTGSSDPDEDSNEYTAPLNIDSTTTLKVIAVSSDGVKSRIGTFVYVIDNTYVMPPVIAPAKDTITIAEAVSITTNKGTIHYTIDNATVNASSPTYSAGFYLTKGTHVVRAIAVYNSKISDISTKTYTVTGETEKVITPVITALTAAPYDTATKFSVSCDTAGATIQYHVDGNSYAAYAASFSLAAGDHIIYAKAVKTGMTDSSEVTLSVTVNALVNGLRIHYEKPSAWSAPSLYYYGATPSSYTTTWETAPAMTLENSTHSCYVYTIENVTSAKVIFKDSSGNQTPGSGQAGFDRSKEGWYYNNNGTYVWSDTNPWEAVIPVISASPVAGTYKAAQQVQLASLNTDDVIYYTSNGDPPTIANAKIYSNTSSIPVTATMTIKAFGVNNKNVSGSVSEFKYVIDPNFDDVAPEITASVAPGYYANGTGVTFTIKDNKSATTTAYYEVNSSIAVSTASSVYWQGDASNGGTGSTLSVAVGETKVFSFLVKDAAGNETIKSFRYTTTAGSTDFREETIYFIMTTRFYDGDSNNNFYCDSTKNAKPEWRGDFKGLIEKLDYIKALGFTAIWLTPVVQNKSDYDYHGYHTLDFNKVDPRLESSGATYKDFIKAAHDKNLKVIQDIVLNHSGNWGVPGLTGILSETNWITRKVMLAATEYYHPNHQCLGSGDYTSYDVEVRPIANECMDLNTENSKVQNYLIDAYNNYIEMGVDAFRIDTVKHVSRYIMNERFIPAFKAKAQSVGATGFYMFGEVCNRYFPVWEANTATISAPFYTWNKGDSNYTALSDADAVVKHWNDNYNTVSSQPTSTNHLLNGNNYHTPDYSQSSGMGVIDFQMHWSFCDAGNAYSVKQYDQYYNDATWNVVYVDSHDYGPNNDGKRYEKGEAAWAENMDLMWTFRGIPCLFYGSEIQFMAGKLIDDYFSALDSTGRAYYGDNLEGTVTASDFGTYTATGTVSTTLSSPLSKHVRHLNKIRRQIPALQKGQYSTDGCSGNIAFKRRYTKDGEDSMVAVTISGNATFTGLPSGKWVDAITGDVQNGTTITTKNCTTQGNLRIYVLNGSGQITGESAYLK